MHNRCLLLLPAFVVFTLAATAQTLPDKAAVLEAMQRANAYFVAKWPDPGVPIVTDRSRPSNIWTRATGNADNQCSGQVYLELYQIDSQPARIANVRTSLLAMVNSTKRDDWHWIDALHMAMPVFAKLGAIDNDTRYAQTMFELFDDTRTRRGLYNTTEHLW